MYSTLSNHINWSAFELPKIPTMILIKHFETKNFSVVIFDSITESTIFHTLNWGKKKFESVRQRKKEDVSSKRLEKRNCPGLCLFRYYSNNFNRYHKCVFTCFSTTFFFPLLFFLSFAFFASFRLLFFERIILVRIIRNTE